MSAKNEQLLDNIWVTSKTRMIAEERYRSYSLAAHIFTSYYSLLLIIFSIFSSDISGFTAEFDKIILTLAVLVFSLSLILGGFHFSETADKHRECYLKLQTILHYTSQQNIGESYVHILKEYPTHLPMDHEYLTVKSAIYFKKPLTRITQSGTKEDIQPSTKMIITYYRRRFIFPTLIYSLAILMPIIGIVLAWAVP